MLDTVPGGFYGFLQENMGSEASITYRKEAGMDGVTTLQADGLGGMLFDGVCTILKGLAMEEEERSGSAGMAGEYVRLVCSMVLSEIGKEG